MARLRGKVAFITGGRGGARGVIAEIDKAAGQAAAEEARARAGSAGGARGSCTAT